MQSPFHSVCNGIAAGRFPDPSFSVGPLDGLIAQGHNFVTVGTQVACFL